MSPSEFDLRAALRDGEDDARLDVDGVVAGARGRLAQRRMRVLSAAAAVVVVGGAGVAAATVWGRGNDGRQQAGPATAATATGSAVTPTTTTPTTTTPATAAPDAGAAQASSRAAAGSVPAAVCPTTYPQVLLPGGGSPGQFGSDGAMFAKPVASLFVCGYGAGVTTAPVTPAVRVYTESSAAALAASIEHAAKTPPAERCPAIVLANRNRLVLVAIATDGTRERDVTTTLSVPACGVRVTNGTAIRYSWQPPREFEAQLLALRPSAAPSSRPSLLPIGPSEPLHGSPLH